MTEIIKKGDSYWYGDIEMELVPDGCCESCPIIDECRKRGSIGCANLVGPMQDFKLKEKKTTMTTRIFTIDNGDKQFKAKLWLEERNVCFQVLKNSDNLNNTKNIIACCVDTEIRKNIINANSVDDDEIGTKRFDTNAGRDAYFAKVCGWLQEFCDVNGVVEKFDVYDVSPSHQFLRNGYKEGCYNAMNENNFAGIKYNGFDCFHMNRKIKIGDTLHDCSADENAEVAKPIQIRFFRVAK